MTLSYFTYILVSNIGFLTTAVFMKQYADGAGWFYLVVALTIAALSYITHANILPYGFANAAIIASVTYQLCIVLVGVFLFGEKLNAYGFAALGFSVAAMWLFYLSSTSNPSA